MKPAFIMFTKLMFIIFFCWGCEKNRIAKYEDKVRGTWAFEKVTKNTSIGSSNNIHTALWSHYQITFHRSGEVTLLNTRSQEVAKGTYVIFKSDLAADEEYPYYLDIQIARGNSWEQYYWYFRNVNKNKLRILEYDGNDTYYYRLGILR